jgi:hypothetical protein
MKYLDNRAQREEVTVGPIYGGTPDRTAPLGPAHEASLDEQLLGEMLVHYRVPHVGLDLCRRLLIRYLENRKTRNMTKTSSLFTGHHTSRQDDSLINYVVGLEGLGGANRLW